MLILEPIADPLRERQDPDNPRSAPIADLFNGLVSEMIFYRLRPSILHALADYEAELEESMDEAKLKRTLFRSNMPLKHHQKNEILAAFHKEYNQAEWYDRILGYIALHDGFLHATEDRVIEGFTLDVSHGDRVYAYTITPENHPRSVQEWDALARAWHNYLAYNEHDGDQPLYKDDEPASLQAIHMTLDLVRMECGYAIEMIDSDNGSMLTFKIGDHSASMILHGNGKHPDDPAARYDYSITEHWPPRREKGLMTYGELQKFAFETLPAWHEKAGVKVRPVQDFEERSRVLMDLRHEEFSSGLPRPTAEITNLFPRLKR